MIDKPTLYFNALKALHCPHPGIERGYDIQGKAIEACTECGMTITRIPCKKCKQQADYEKTRGNFYCYPCRDKPKEPRTPIPKHWTYPHMIQSYQERQKFFRKKKGHRKGRRQK